MTFATFHTGLLTYALHPCIPLNVLTSNTHLYVGNLLLYSDVLSDSQKNSLGIQFVLYLPSC